MQQSELLLPSRDSLLARQINNNSKALPMRYRNHFSVMACLLLTTVVAIRASAQQPTTPRTRIAFCIAWIEEGEGLMVLSNKPQTRERTVVVTRYVPEQVTAANGTPKTVMRSVQEERTQTYEVLVPEQRSFSAGSYTVYRMSGERLSANAVATALRTKQKAIFVPSGQKLDSWFRDIVKPNTLVVVQKTVRPDSTPPEVPGVGEPPEPPVPANPTE